MMDNQGPCILFDRELRWSRLPQDALNGAALGVVAGLFGAKLLYVFEHRGEEPLIALLTSRAIALGLTVAQYGALAIAALGALLIAGTHASTEQS